MKNLLIALLGLCLISVSQAADFQSLNSGTTNNLNDVTFTSSLVGYAAGIDGTLIKTTDGGTTWAPLTTNVSNHLQSLYFVNANLGFAVGTGGVVLKTTNAGANWVMSFPTGSDLYDVYFIDQNTGYIVGNFATCMMTTNGGTNWSYQSVPLGNSALLISVVFNAGKGFIGAASTSNLLTTTNGGANWVDNKIRAGTPKTFDIAFNGMSGLAVGNEFVSFGVGYPVIFMTLNNGQGWSEYSLQNRNAGLSSTAIVPNSPSVCYAVGSYINDATYGNKGLIMMSTNGGATWQEQAYGTGTISLNAVCVTATDCFIVGDNGRMLKTTHPIGIQNISSEVPNGYRLSQNYPNPFNPVTNIEFSLPSKGQVKLTVFDITGREVEILVNTVLSAGSYKYDFDAKDLTSGVYFYRLVTDGFVETKKMMLVK